MAHVRIRGKKKALYIRFWYDGVEHQRPSGHYCIGSGTPHCACKQCKLAKLLASEVERKILLNEFDFDKYFSVKESNRAKRTVYQQPTAEQISTHTDIEQYKYGSYARKWLTLMESAIAFSTYDSYKTHINVTMSFIGENRDIRSFVYSDMQELVSFLKNRKVGNKTIKNYLSTFSGLFRFMIKDQILTVNPASQIIIKENSLAEDDEVLDDSGVTDVSEEVYSPDEVLSILDYAKRQYPWMVLYFAIGFYTGARSGELLALTWNDIDLEERRIHIWKTRTSRKLKKTPKTSSGKRHVPIEDELVPYILDHKRYISEDGHFFTHNADLFLNKNRTPYKSYGSVVNQYWKPMLEVLGLPYRQPYYSRHTFACIMIERGVNLKTIASILGHKDLTMVLKIYGNKIMRKVGHENYMRLLEEHTKDDRDQEG